MELAKCIWRREAEVHTPEVRVAFVVFDDFSAPRSNMLLLACSRAKWFVSEHLRVHLCGSPSVCICVCVRL